MSSPRRILHSRTFNDRNISNLTQNLLLERERNSSSAPTTSSPLGRASTTPVFQSNSSQRSNSPDGGSSQFDIQCCCGQPACEARLKNTAVVSELEQNVQTAAQLGQALLRQADEAEKIRTDMTAKLRALEDQNKHLDFENSLSIERNRDLLNKLEELNESVSQADTRVRELTADIDDTRAELDRVSARAARAEILEAQLTVLETEQEDLRRNLSLTKEDERNAVARWQKVERQTADLQEQYNRLETEYMNEKTKTQRLAAKISARKSIKDLHFPASKMEGAAISNFMKEILQDNQQLQAGTAELRQMLIIAQDEIGSLREQVLHNHQRPEPVELGRSPLAHEFDGYHKLSQELHVHHHHHVSTKEGKGSVRKVKRRVKGSYSRPSLPASPAPQAWPQFEQSASSSKRSSIQSTAYSGHTRSSSFPNTVVSDTPASTYRDSSIFDRNYNIDDSRPTSAGSMGPGMPISPSPLEKKRGHGRQFSSYNTPSFSALNEEEFPDTLAPVTHTESAPSVEALESPVEQEESSSDSPQFDLDSNPQNEEEIEIPDAFQLSTPSPYLATTIPGRKLVRSASHESLLAPETAPVDIFLTPKGARAPIAVSSSTSAIGTLEAIITPVTARNSSAMYSSTTYNRLLLSSMGGPTPKSPPKQARGVGSWFWGRFGGAKPAAQETASSSLARHVEVADDSSITTTASESGEAGSTKSAASSIRNLSSSPQVKSGMMRAPPGLVPRKSSPIVLATPVDEEALAEVLAE